MSHIDFVLLLAGMTTIEPRRKPDSDNRAYRLIQLPNGLDCVLISDPETQTAAAAMAVAAGQLQDPPEVQGLAHFCEHMLFLGNKKFPGESDFDSFCAQSAGYSNAWTSLDRTVYHFMLAHDRLVSFMFHRSFCCNGGAVRCPRSVFWVLLRPPVPRRSY